MSRHTLLLNERWDLTLDSSGNIAQVTDEYAIAQDVANAIRLFTNEAFFDMDRGIPHYDLDLGVKPTLSVVRARMRDASVAIEGVAIANPVLEYDDDERKLTGHIELTTESGETASVAV